MLLVAFLFGLLLLLLQLFQLLRLLHLFLPSLILYVLQLLLCDPYFGTSNLQDSSDLRSLQLALLNNDFLLEFELGDLPLDVNPHIQWVDVHIHKGSVHELRHLYVQNDAGVVRRLREDELILALVALPDVT